MGLNLVMEHGRFTAVRVEVDLGAALREASDAAVPETWDCPRCGFPAGQDQENPPAPPHAEPYKTHLAYVKERRNDTDGAAILAEALDRLRRGA